jgi:rare lipoprotein A
MNQHRWTCLATVVLTTVIGPIATVNARTLPAPVVTSGNNYIPVSPQSLPTITPLVVTELQTETVAPATFKPVPTVSKLPVIATIQRTKKVPARAKSQPKVTTLGKKLTPQSPISKLPPVSYTYNSTVGVTTPLSSFPNPTPTVATIVNSVAPLPSVVLTPAAKTPATAPLKAPSQTVATISSIDKIPVNSLPQISSIASSPKDRSDSPSFEFGTPVFSMPVFGASNSQTQQIVNTVIAQVGDTIVAPEPSIAIPVEVPKQSTATPQIPAAQPPVTQPGGTGIVKIEPPEDTVKPTLDKIVATQSGQASWYGSEGGSRTANGERYNPRGLTAAHRTLPFGTKVRITSLKTGKTVTVRINDRGPFHSRRIVDISAGAAEVIGIKNDGVGNVRMDVLATDG